MKLITCAGYYGTGTSAVTDLFSEFSNVKNLGSDFECCFAHDLYGLSDLEYYLCETNHRHNASIAISNFIKLMGIYGLNKKTRMVNYPSFFGTSFKDSVDTYLNDLIGISFSGGSHANLYSQSNNFITDMKIKNRLWRMTHRTKKITILDSSYLGYKKTPYDRFLSKQTTYFFDPQIDFYSITKKFTRNLFTNYKSYEYVFVDQLVPPNNISRYLNYFDDLCVLVVDRDPRDLFILENHYWHSGIIPSDIDDFIKWYRLSRQRNISDKDDPKVVLRIMFEDLVFHYETMVKKITRFVGIESSYHKNVRQFFNPNVSVKNTRLWLKHREFDKQIGKIEKELKEFLYTHYIDEAESQIE